MTFHIDNRGPFRKYVWEKCSGRTRDKSTHAQLCSWMWLGSHNIDQKDLRLAQSNHWSLGTLKHYLIFLSIAQIYTRDPRLPIPPRVMASSVMGLNMGVFGFFADHKCKTNVSMIFAYHLFSVLSICSDFRWSDIATWQIKVILITRKNLMIPKLSSGYARIKMVPAGYGISGVNLWSILLHLLRVSYVYLSVTLFRLWRWMQWLVH